MSRPEVSTRRQGDIVKKKPDCTGSIREIKCSVFFFLRRERLLWRQQLRGDNTADIRLENPLRLVLRDTFFYIYKRTQILKSQFRTIWKARCDKRFFFRNSSAGCCDSRGTAFLSRSLLHVLLFFKEGLLCWLFCHFSRVITLSRYLSDSIHFFFFIARFISFLKKKMVVYKKRGSRLPSTNTHVVATSSLTRCILAPSHRSPRRPSPLQSWWTKHTKQPFSIHPPHPSAQEPRWGKQKVKSETFFFFHAQ